MEVRGGLSLIQPIWRIVRQQQETGRVKEKWCVIPWSPTFSNKVVKTTMMTAPGNVSRNRIPKRDNASRGTSDSIEIRIEICSSLTAGQGSFAEGP